MSYIGRGLQAGAFRQLDDISSGFDGSDTTHTMQVNSTNVTVGDVNQILLSLGGVIQKPGTDFTVSSSTLTFTTAPAANTSFFAILLGSDNGGTTTPTDGSVTGDKLASTVTTSSNISLDGGTFVFNESGADKDFRIEGDTKANLFFADASTDRVGINTNAPDMFLDVTGTVTAGGGSDEKLQQWNIDSDNVKAEIEYLDASANRGYAIGTSTGHDFFLRSNDTIGLKLDYNGHVTMPLQSAFHVPGTTQNNIDTGIATARFGGTERFDQNSDFNTSTYTFTAPVTGKYYLSVHVQLADLDNGHDYCRTHLVTSNHTYYLDIISPNVIFSSDAAYVSFQNSLLVDMDANDTAYVQINLNSGSGSQADLTTTQSYFSGFLAC